MRPLLHRQVADASCSLTKWQHFSAWNYIMIAISKVENPTPLIDVYFLDDNSVLPIVIPILLETTELLLKKSSPKKKKNDKNDDKMSSGMRSVPDLR